MQVQGGIGLTQKLVFTDIAVKAMEYVKEQGSVHDVVLMQQLEFTPQSWRIWKPKLIEIFSIRTFRKSSGRDEVGRIKIEYNKKEKLWRAIDIE